MVQDDGVGCGAYGNSTACETVPGTPGAPFFFGNTLYTPSGLASNVSSCGKTLPYWQRQNRNGSQVWNTTTVRKYPPRARVAVDWARDLFGMPPQAH